MSIPHHSTGEFTYVKARCFCRSNEFLVSFLTATLPQASHLCHCSTCRHTTGQLGVDGAIIATAPLVSVPDDETPIEPADLSKLSTYNVTPRLTRFFCYTCGAYMLCRLQLEADKFIWGISTGSLERTEGIVQLRSHVFVKPTKDGGLSKHYRAINRVELPRYAGWGSKNLAEGEKVELLPSDWEDKDLLALKKRSSPEINAHCHCRQISLRLTRPSQEDSEDPSKWWIIPGEEDSGYPSGRKPPRFFGAHCFCSSCRLSHGAIISSCILVPHTNVLLEDGSNITISPSSSARPKNLTQYSSSPDTYREFCSTCGASVFWWTLKKQSIVPVDDGASEPVYFSLSAGLMDEEEGGALSEAWVSWSERVGYPEDALDKAVVEAVQNGLRAR